MWIEKPAVTLPSLTLQMKYMKVLGFNFYTFNIIANEIYEGLGVQFLHL